MKFISFICSIPVLNALAGHSDPSKHIEIQFLPVPAKSKALENPSKSDSHHKLSGHGALPLQQFMKLFPLDIPSKAHVRVIHIGQPAGAAGHPINDILGDNMLDSILSELSHGFHSDMKPLLAGLHAVSRGAQHPCEPDIEKLCQDDQGHGHKHESELHCLGLHANELSTECAKEVQQSLPFMCSWEISRYCSAQKTIDMSVLQCLEEKADSNSPLGYDCKDSISATRAILAKMKTQNIALVDRRTGEIIRSTASMIAAPLYASAYVAVLGILALMLYAFWVRDDETSFFKSVTRTLRELGIRARRSRSMTKSQKGETFKTVELKSTYL
jgi:hypothetical protein